MLKTEYKPESPYSYVMYARMSDEKLQNERSPDQQFQTIITKIERRNLPWRKLQEYRDDGKKGAYLVKRPEFQRMLREIEMGIIKPDLIVVDTAERLGRADEIGELRRKLRTDYGILVVTADKDFADPTGIVGKSVEMVETLRSTENTRITGHNVIRGKVDVIRLGQWPGGNPPLGMRLRKVLKEIKGKAVTESYLEAHETDRPYAVLLFDQALRSGHGPNRLARWWNKNPSIPDRLKPMCSTSIAAILRNELYIGRMVWGANLTGIVNDVRVLQVNPEGSHITVDDYCEPLVDPVVFKQVNDLAAMRREAHLVKLAKNANPDTREGQDAPRFATQGRGLSLVYLLSGLVRCECGAAMRPTPSGRRRKDGTTYSYYCCPHARAGACENHSSLREELLRPAVVEAVKRRLFPAAGNDGLPDWLPEITGLIETELSRYRDRGPERAVARKEEKASLEESIQGWSVTLALPKLPPGVREDIVVKYDAAQLRLQEIETEAAQEAAAATVLATAVSPETVLAEIDRLSEAMAAENATMNNLVLSRHIDKILSTRDGDVELIGTFLGVFGDTIDLLDILPPSPEAASTTKGRHRRRTRLYVPSLTVERSKRLTKATTVLDAERFKGYPDHYFWKEKLVLAKTLSWAETYAAAVAARRREGVSMEALSEQFGVTPPTIRHALKIAKSLDPTLTDLPKKSRRSRWEESHFKEVARLHGEGKTVKELSQHFDVSEPLIRASLKLAQGD